MRFAALPDRSHTTAERLVCEVTCLDQRRVTLGESQASVMIG